MREDGKEGRVIVIISDGMRYECARELYENLELDEKCDAEIDYMLSVLPSETTLGMVSLLPHEDIAVSPNLDRLAESDKISMDKTAFSFKNKRYLLSLEPAKNDALISRTLTYLGKMNEIFVSTPKGADIIKTQGGGQNYVHGGSSLQEMVVPVLKVKTFKGRQDTGTVSVELSSFHNRITEAAFKLEFMQMEPVTDTVKPRSLVAFFVDGNGSKISFDVPVIARVRDTDARQRRIVEKFTLKSGKYTRGHNYFLVLADMEDERKEYRRYKFEIDIVDM